MSRADTRRPILIATSNMGKYREITQVLAESPIAARVLVEWRSLADLPAPIPAPEETGLTFAANATLKAETYSRATGWWTLADDSGLEADALGGAPGVHSARYAGLPEGSPRAENDVANNQKLIAALAGVPQKQRTARFRCVLVLADGDRVLAQAEGSVEGLIIDDPRGNNGFGYDPHFFLPTLGRTMAELPAEEKNRLSHRGQALRRLHEQLPGLLRQAESSGTRRAER